MVKLSTGNDFVEMVIKCALREEPRICKEECDKVAAVKFAFNEEDCDFIQEFVQENQDKVIQYQIERKGEVVVEDSSSRWGYCIAIFDSREEAIQQLQM